VTPSKSASTTRAGRFGRHPRFGLCAIGLAARAVGAFAGGRIEAKAVVLGMTFQVSDVQITSWRLRRVARPPTRRTLP